MQKPADHLLNDMMLTVRWLTMRQQKMWRPATDVYETDDTVIVKVEIAGMDEQDFTISLSNRTLVITGARRDPEPKLAYQQLEIPYGEFRTEVFLPYAVDHEKITASYKDGFLMVLLPKTQSYRIAVVESAAQQNQKQEQ